TQTTISGLQRVERLYPSVLLGPGRGVRGRNQDGNSAWPAVRLRGSQGSWAMATVRATIVEN
ncbi:MAG: hypothetical protein ACRDRW_03365, partial [Pseudonocardiaceae bacterium]